MNIHVSTSLVMEWMEQGRRRGMRSPRHNGHIDRMESTESYRGEVVLDVAVWTFGGIS